MQVATKKYIDSPVQFARFALTETNICILEKFTNGISNSSWPLKPNQSNVINIHFSFYVYATYKQLPENESVLSLANSRSSRKCR